MKINARQYYYTYIRSNEAGMSYQKVHQAAHYEQSISKEMKKIFNHIPKRSNDVLLESIIKNLISINSHPDIKKRLENVFVAKENKKLSNAGAFDKNDSYFGDLVFFNVGLSDLCYQFCTQFYEFTISDDINLFDKIKVSVVRMVKLAIMTLEWKKTKIIQLTDLLLIPLNIEYERKIANIASLTDNFILCHEIAHHLLGHTGRKSISENIFSQFPEDAKFWIKSTDSHAKEYQADMLAILLNLGIIQNTFPLEKKFNNKNGITATLGTLLTLYTLKAVTDHPDSPSDSHPSINNRIKQAETILKLVIEEKMYSSIHEDITNFYNIFHSVLKRTQQNQSARNIMNDEKFKKYFPK